MEKPRTQEAILNQTAIVRGERVQTVSYLIRFNKLSATKGPGAVMTTIMENPGLLRKDLVELLHKKFHTTGQYVEMLESLAKSGVIGHPDGQKSGFVLTDLGRDVLRENGLI